MKLKLSLLLLFIFCNSWSQTSNLFTFKPAPTSKTSLIERHRLWLNMTNTQGAFKQLLVGYIQGATNGYDSNFDGLTFDGNAFIDFYSINSSRNLVIQGRALPFVDTDNVPLGYRSIIAGDFTISIEKADGLLANQVVFLEDKLTNTITNLRVKGYTFTTETGVFNNRFVLRYSNNSLATGDFETHVNSIAVVSQNKTITINSGTESIDKVFIYDVFGKQLYTKQNVSNVELLIENLEFTQQVLLIKIVLENGNGITKKLIIT